MHINEWPDHILARLFFRTLWQRYDAGGVSVGRSLRSDLVENYLALVPLENGELYECHYELNEMGEEAGGRTPQMRMEKLEGFEDSHLRAFDKRNIAFLCIAALQAWYLLHEGEDTSDGLVADPWQKAAIDKICGIMPIPVLPANVSDEYIKKINRMAKSHLMDITIAKSPINDLP